MMRFRRQHPIGPFVLDFFCAAASLAVEVDGAVHDLPVQIAYDEGRDHWLGRQGIRVLRIAAKDILDRASLEGVLREIEEAGKPA